MLTAAAEGLELMVKGVRIDKDCTDGDEIDELPAEYVPM